MFEKIRDLIVEEVGVDEEQVTMDASFKNDLNIDSLDLFEMVMTLEEEFDVEIPSEDLENIDTVGRSASTTLRITSKQSDTYKENASFVVIRYLQK